MLCSRHVWAALRQFSGFYASYFPSKPGPAVLDTSHRMSHAESWQCVSLLPYKRCRSGRKTGLQRQTWHFKRVNLLQLNLIITKHCYNLIIVIITEYASRILFCFLLYKDTQIFKVIKWLILWTQVDKNTIYAWKANRTEVIKSYKTVKCETNSAVFVMMVKILHNNEGFADTA